MKAKRVKKLDPRAPLVDNAARIVRVRLDEMRSFPPAALRRDGSTEQHDMRIAAKRLRYVLETTEFCFGLPAETARRRARDLQDVLGDLHDCDVMLPRVAEHIGQLRREDAEIVRRRAGSADDLDPALAAAAPHRAKYRGLEVLAVYVDARRAVLFDRFVELWGEHERDGTWDELERALDQRVREARERRAAAERAARAARELERGRARRARGGRACPTRRRGAGRRSPRPDPAAPLSSCGPAYFGGYPRWVAGKPRIGDRSTAVVAVGLLALVSALTAATSAAAAASPGAAGLGDPFFPKAGNGGYDVQSYRIALRYRPSRDEINARTTIRARATQDLSGFDLDFRGPRVRSVRVDEVAVPYRREGQELIIAPVTPIADAAKFTVKVSYRGRVGTISSPDGSKEGWFTTDDGSLVADEPQGAPTWFPSNDHPTDKATFDFRVRVPRGLEAIANGELTDRRRVGGPHGRPGTRRSRWQPTWRPSRRASSSFASRRSPAYRR